MSKSRGLPILLITAFVLFTLCLYFFTDTKSENQRAVETSRAMMKQSVSPELLLREAIDSLTNERKNRLETMRVSLQQAETDEEKVAWLKQISSAWYAMERPDIAGYYAEKINELRPEDVEALSIAGSTYTAALNLDGLSKRSKDFAAERARAMFEQAGNLEPFIIVHKINHALTFVYRPLEDQPMKGILDLVGLSKTYPKEPLVQKHLAVLALQTGQIEKAKQRVRNALLYSDDKKELYCLMTAVLERANETDSLMLYKQLCEKAQ